MADIKATLDTREFDRTLRQKIELTQKSIPESLNRAAYFIARGALRNTPKADKAKIAAELGTVKLSKRKGAKVTLTKAAIHDAPLAALLVNKGRRPGLYGAAMADAIRVLIGKRNRSIAFLKAGWLPAIRALEPLVPNKSGAPRRDASAKQFGKDWGAAEAARKSWNAKATIENFANSPNDKKGALTIYGLPALQKAFNDEAKSMMEYLERKMRENAAKLGIRHG